MIDGLVSIIIPAYNVEKFIGRCLKSMINQTYNNIEVLVVYDKSEDNTLEVIKYFEKRYKEKIKVIKQPKKTSPAIAMNKGLTKAEGEFIAFCGADDFFEASKIEKQVKYLKKHKNVGLVYTDAYIINEEGRIIKYYKCPEWNKRKWLYNHYIIISSVLIKRNVLEKVGMYYDESLKTCEDLDLLIRLSNITNFKRLPEFLTYYTIHNKNLSKEKSYMFDVDRIKVFYKHGLVLPLFHSIFTFFRNQVIMRIPIVNELYERGISKRFKRQHFWMNK